jgi:hypothetical protein
VAKQLYRLDVSPESAREMGWTTHMQYQQLLCDSDVPPDIVNAGARMRAHVVQALSIAEPIPGIVWFQEIAWHEEANELRSFAPIPLRYRDLGAWTRWLADHPRECTLELAMKRGRHSTADYDLNGRFITKFPEVILVKVGGLTSYKTALIIAHELRHRWQYDHGQIQLGHENVAAERDARAFEVYMRSAAKQLR